MSCADTGPEHQAPPRRVPGTQGFVFRPAWRGASALFCAAPVLALTLRDLPANQCAASSAAVGAGPATPATRSRLTSGMQIRSNASDTQPVLP